MTRLRGSTPLVVRLRGGNTAAVEAALQARHADILAAKKDGAVSVEVGW